MDADPSLHVQSPSCRTREEGLCDREGQIRVRPQAACVHLRLLSQLPLQLPLQWLLQNQRLIRGRFCSLRYTGSGVPADARVRSGVISRYV